MAKSKDAPDGLSVSVTNGAPPLTVVVREGNEVGHEGVAYGPGDELELDGPTAFALFQQGHVELKGTI